MNSVLKKACSVVCSRGYCSWNCTCTCKKWVQGHAWKKSGLNGLWGRASVLGQASEAARLLYRMSQHVWDRLNAIFCIIPYYSVLFCIIPYYSVLFCIILYYSVLFCIIPYYSVLFRIILYYSVLFCKRIFWLQLGLHLLLQRFFVIRKHRN